MIARLLNLTAPFLLQRVIPIHKRRKNRLVDDQIDAFESRILLTAPPLIIKYSSRQSMNSELADSSDVRHETGATEYFMGGTLNFSATLNGSGEGYLVDGLADITITVEENRVVLTQISRLNLQGPNGPTDYSRPGSDIYNFCSVGVYLALPPDSNFVVRGNTSLQISDQGLDTYALSEANYYGPETFSLDLNSPGAQSFGFNGETSLRESDRVVIDGQIYSSTRAGLSFLTSLDMPYTEENVSNWSGSAEVISITELVFTTPSQFDLGVAEVVSVSPTQHSDLHLFHIFGTEQIDLPFTITNYRGENIDTTVTAKAYLADTPNLKSGSNATPLGTKSGIKVTLKKGETLKQKFESLTIPGGLVAGSSKYLVVEITGNYDDSIFSNNVTATVDLVYTGTPASAYASIFQPNGFYFKTISETLGDTGPNTAVKEKDPSIDVNNARSFIKAFEGNRNYSYLDGVGIPTISYGINMRTMATDVGLQLAQDARTNVRRYRRMTDAAVLNDLQAEAAANTDRARRGKKVKEVISTSQSDHLFDLVIPNYEAAAITKFTNAKGTWSKLTLPQRTTLIDMQYNGATYPTMISHMAKDDMVSAGFELMNSQDMLTALSNPNLRGVQLRMKARYQNLFSVSPYWLGWKDRSVG